MNIEHYAGRFQDEMKLRNFCKSTIKTYKCLLTQFLVEHKSFNQPKDISVEVIKTEINQFI